MEITEAPPWKERLRAMIERLDGKCYKSFSEAMRPLMTPEIITRRVNMNRLVELGFVFEKRDGKICFKYVGHGYESVYKDYLEGAPILVD